MKLLTFDNAYDVIDCIWKESDVSFDKSYWKFLYEASLFNYAVKLSFSVSSGKVNFRCPNIHHEVLI